VLPQCGSPLQARNALGSRAIAEYRKTARMVRAMPWSLVQAAQHLENWVDANEKNLPRGPPIMKFALDLMHDRVLEMGIDVDPHGWHRYASEELMPVRHITVMPQSPTAKRRRAAPAVSEVAVPVTLPPEDMFFEEAGLAGEKEQDTVLGLPGPEPAPVAQAVQAGVPAPPRQLGCGRCRWGAKGCTICKAPTYVQRVRSRGRGRVAADPMPQVALDLPLSGGRGSGGRGRSRGRGRGRPGR
jgi:hypothetical protein